MGNQNLAPQLPGVTRPVPRLATQNDLAATRATLPVWWTVFLWAVRSFCVAALGFAYVLNEGSLMAFGVMLLPSFLLTSRFKREAPDDLSSSLYDSDFGRFSHDPWRLSVFDPNSPSSPWRSGLDPWSDPTSPSFLWRSGQDT